MEERGREFGKRGTKGKRDRERESYINGETELNERVSKGTEGERKTKRQIEGERERERE